MLSSIAVIGTGVVGSSVALLLHKKGYPVRGLCSKHGHSALKLAQRVSGTFVDLPEKALDDAKIIFLTTPDREIEGLAKHLAQSGKACSEHVFVHMSGALPLDILLPLQETGAGICSIHPLQSFASIEKAVESLAGSWFAVQHDDKTRDLAYNLVSDLKGKGFSVSNEQKAIYHMGACVASNYLVSLIDFAVALYANIGLEAEQALEALLPLIKGTLSNIESLGTIQALTGPVARGDIETVKRHLNALSKMDILSKKLYKTLGEYTTEVALQKESIDSEKAEIMKKLFQEGYVDDIRR